MIDVGMIDCFSFAFDILIFWFEGFYCYYKNFYSLFLYSSIVLK